jgi:DNA-binding GntR family transcriptional regulator
VNEPLDVHSPVAPRRVTGRLLSARGSRACRIDVTNADHIDIVQPQQLKDVAYRRLRDALVDLTIPPGAALRENDLAQRLGVSKTPIREALVRLERDGLVELTPYRGARARSYSAHDLREIFELRELIEGECVRRAAQRSSTLDQARLAANVRESEEALRRGSMEEVARLLDEFDELLLGQLHNRFLADLIDRVGLHLRRIGRLAVSPRRFSASVEQHRAVCDAIAQRRPALADRLLKEHLRNVLDDQVRALGQDLAGKAPT